MPKLKELNPEQLEKVSGGSDLPKYFCVTCLQVTTPKTVECDVVEIRRGQKVTVTTRKEVCSICGFEYDGLCCSLIQV